MNALKKLPKILILEKLNLFSFVFLVITKFRFRTVYYIEKNNRNNRLPRLITTTFNLKGLSYSDFPALYFEIIESAVQWTERYFTENNVRLAKCLIKFGEDERYIHPVKKMAADYFFKILKVYFFAREIGKRNPDCKVKIVPSSNVFLSKYVHELYAGSNVSLVKPSLWAHYITETIKRMVMIVIATVFPFLLFVKKLISNNVILSQKEKPIEREIFFEHRFGFLEKRVWSDFLYFKNGVFRIDQAIHASSFERFNQEKKDYLEDNGGILLDHSEIKMDLKYFTNFLNRYYKLLLPTFIFNLFQKESNSMIALWITMIVPNIIKAELLLQYITVKVIVFRTDYPLFYHVLTIVANKKDIKTVSMCHGDIITLGPQLYGDVFDYFFMWGDFYIKKHGPFMKGIRNIPIVGPPNTDHIYLNMAKKNEFDWTKEIKDKGRKIIAVFATSFFSKDSHPTKIKALLLLFYRVVFDWTKGRDDIFPKTLLLHFYRVVFDWAKGRDDIFLFVKPKGTNHEFKHPEFQDLLLSFPSDRILIDPAMDPYDLLSVIDWCICTNSSSLGGEALIAGIPVTYYDLRQLGEYHIYRKYYHRLVARNQEELVAYLNYGLENGFPEKVIKEIRRNHYAGPEFDGNCFVRIKKIFSELLETSNGTFAQYIEGFKDFPHTVSIESR
ncbi:MAG: hypothetical protein AB1401_03140 [Thermodesulfobacteriota bacterium]